MGTLSIPQVGQPNSTEQAKVKTALETLNGLLNSENKIANSLRLYPPKVIATEQTRTNTAFGTLETPDEVKEVVVPENGIVLVGYNAAWKPSGAGAGRAAIFIGANQLKAVVSAAPEVQEATSSSASFNTLGTRSGGLNSVEGNGAFVTTGQVLGIGAANAGPVWISHLAAGTYNISVQYRATSGSITAKERKLWVAVIGS